MHSPLVESDEVHGGLEVEEGFLLTSQGAISYHVNKHWVPHRVLGQLPTSVLTFLYQPIFHFEVKGLKGVVFNTHNKFNLKE